MSPEDQAAHLVQVDATNRAWRTFLQGLGIDVAVAIAVALLAWLPDADIASRTAWLILAGTLTKSILQAGASYVMRRFLDRTKVVPDALTPPALTGE